MFDRLLPHCTYRRFAARLAVDFVRGRVSLAARFNRDNWKRYLEYRQRSLRCNVCGKASPPFFDFPDVNLRREHRIGELRETLQCRHCRATMRHRTLAAALLRRVSAIAGRQLASIEEAAAARLSGLKVLDTDPFSPIAGRLKHLPDYWVSSFQPDQPFDAELSPRHWNVNLEKIGFPDAAFDVVLTSDVMEHVRGIDAAHAEIHRILRRGGAYIFTVPYDARCDSHHELVDTRGPTDRFIVPPQYHGDPLTGGILAYRVFGRALHTDLAALGFEVEFLEINDAGALIVGGDVFIASKAPAC
jgi:SAM-dependent methyltransferase